MRQPAPEPFLTPEAYLEFERLSLVKHEYAGGRLFALAGASDEHVRITLNIAAALLAATRQGRAGSTRAT